MKLNIDIKRNVENKYLVKKGDKVFVPYCNHPLIISKIQNNHLVLSFKGITYYTLAAKEDGWFIFTEVNKKSTCQFREEKVKVSPVGSEMIPVLQQEIDPSGCSVEFFYTDVTSDISTPENGYEPVVDDLVIGELYIKTSSYKDDLRLVNREYIAKVASVVHEDRWIAMPEDINKCVVRQHVVLVGDCGAFTILGNEQQSLANVDGFVFVPKMAYIK